VWGALTRFRLGNALGPYLRAPILELRGSSFGWTSSRATYVRRITQQAKDLFGNDGETGETGETF
jgi:hypothetical protein